MIGGVVLILAGFFGFVFVGWPALLRLVRLLLPGSIRCEFSAGPEAVTDASQPKVVRNLVRELQALGFQPLGLKREWWPLRKASQALELVSPDVKSFATVYNLGANPRVYFYTAFKDGAVVLTADHENANVELADFIHAGINLGKPNELLTLHSKKVQQLCKAQHPPCTEFDQLGRLDATRAFYAHRGVSRMLRGIMKRDLIYVAVPLGLMALGGLSLALRLR